MIRLLLSLCLILLPTLAAAQEGTTRLSRLLESQLSDGEDRVVSITGFEGALSSEASLDRLTIADADGVWLILDGVILDWNRSALLRGSLQVTSLTAQRLEVVRTPNTPDGLDLPDAEATPFALPDLPVRVNIEEFAIAELVLGEPVIGIAASLSIEGNLLLAGGAGTADITLDRLDGPTGQFALQASYDNMTENLSVSLLLEEAEGGLAAELLDLPGRPSIRLGVEGEGPVNEFTADINLATDGEDRITGQVITSLGNNGDQLLLANIGGDISPLVGPEYQGFFGDNVQLQAQVRQTAAGSTELEALRLSSAALTLEGSLSLDPRGLPIVVDLTGQITPPEGDTVRLPAEANLTVAGADLVVSYDRMEGDTYSLALILNELVADDLTLGNSALTLAGVVAISPAGIDAATAQLTGSMTGVEHADPAFAQALGEAFDLSADLSWVANAPVMLSNLVLSAGDLEASGGASATATEEGVNFVLDISAQAADLTRFAAVAGQPLDGSVNVTLAGNVQPLDGSFDLAIGGTARDLRVADAVPAQIFAGQTRLSAGVVRDETGLSLNALRLESAELSLAADAAISSGDTSATLRFELNNVGLFTDVLSGPVAIGAEIARAGTEPFDIAATITSPNAISVAATGQFDAETTEFDLALDATADDLDVGNGVPPELLAGRTQLSLQAASDNGTYTLTGLSLTNPQLSLSGDAIYGPGDSSASLSARLEDVGLFTDIISGPVSLGADIARTGTQPFDITANLRGPNQIGAEVSGQVDIEFMDFNLALDATATGLNPGNGIPPQLLAGRTIVSVVAAREDEVLTVSRLILSNPELRLNGDARIGPDTSRVTVDARLSNVGLFTDALSGAVSADATLTRNGDDPWSVAADLGGPGGMRADVNGRFGLPNGAVDLRAAGQAPLALANRFIAPRTIRGTLNFDLAVNGQPGLGAVSGSLRASDARVSAPTFAVALENVGLNAQISSGRLTLDADGNLSTGGQVSANGAINLGSAALESQITIGVRNGRLVDPTLYEALISSADIAISGPLARRPQISGTVILGESEIRVPEASLVGSAAIPDITFVGESRDARLTRQFAGLLGRSSGGSGGSNTVGLDITIDAPGRIYLRGRGIDAEFGGSVRIFGTTANVIPTGQFNLIRGRLSILGTRLDFTEGSATLQGSFDPFLRLAATSRASGYAITIGVVGSASSPEITFSSDPSLPEDEVLAQLLFGRSVSGLSPLQLLQLADAATSLAGGSSNSGFIAGLRDGLGLDDLDLSTDEEGNAAVTAGRYLSENIYSDVTINAEGDADLSLNIDLTPSITARGSVGSDGGSSIGIFFEQDY